MLNKKKDIEVKIFPWWNVDVNIYDSKTKKIELRIRIKNNSSKGIKVEEFFLYVRKQGFLFPFYEELLITSTDRFITPTETYEFEYDLKPVLEAYGEKRKFKFVVKGEKIISQSISINIKELDSFIKNVFGNLF